MPRDNGSKLRLVMAMVILGLSAPGLAWGATLAELRQAEQQADEAYSQARSDHASGDARIEEMEAARENLREARKALWKAGDEASQREYDEFMATLSPPDEDPPVPPAPDAGADAETPAGARLSHDENGNPVVDGALGEGEGTPDPVRDALDRYHFDSENLRNTEERFEDGDATEEELEEARERLRESWRNWWEARRKAESKRNTRVDFSSVLLDRMIVARPAPLTRDPMEPEGFDPTEVEVLNGADEQALPGNDGAENLEPVAVEHAVEVEQEPIECAD